MLLRMFRVSLIIAFAAACGKDRVPPTASTASLPASRTTLAETISIAVGEEASVLLPKGTLLPASHAEVFSTAVAGQPTFGVQLLVGDSTKASNNRALTDVAVPLEHPGPRGVPQIDFTISIDAKGRITVDATERGGNGRFHHDALLIAVQ